MNSKVGKLTTRRKNFHVNPKQYYVLVGLEHRQKYLLHHHGHYCVQHHHILHHSHILGLHSGINKYIRILSYAFEINDTKSILVKLKNILGHHISRVS